MHTKDRIVRAAIKNFLNYGYEKASLSTIAKEVGIKKPSLYHHFKNKDMIFEASIDFLLSSIEEKVIITYEKEKTARYNLERFFNAVIEVNSELSLLAGSHFDKPYDLLALLRTSLNHFPALQERINTYYDGLASTLEGIIKNGQKSGEIRATLDPQTLSLELLAWMEGMCMLSGVYTTLSINTLRKKLYDNMWDMIYESYQSKGFFGTKKKRGLPKSLSLGTKW
jgi:AcrR family transcriptional regulator